MPRVHHVKKARKVNPVAKVGEPYYWWKFRYGGKRYSKTYPKRSQLTQSAFLGGMADVEDDVIANVSFDTTDADWRDSIESVASEIEDALQSLADDCQESLDNMPENLQENSSSGEMLQERIDEVESMISELQNITADDKVERDDGESEEDFEKRLAEEEERKAEAVCDAFREISYGGP